MCQIVWFSNSKQAISGIPQIAFRISTLLGSKVFSSMNLCRCPPPRTLLQKFSAWTTLLVAMTLRTSCQFHLFLLILTCLQFHSTTSIPGQRSTTSSTQQQQQVNITSMTTHSPFKQPSGCLRTNI